MISFSSVLRLLVMLSAIFTINQLNLLHISISYPTYMANTVLGSQNILQATVHRHNHTKYTIPQLNTDLLISTLD